MENAELTCPICGGTEFDEPRCLSMSGWRPAFYMLRGRVPWFGGFRGPRLRRFLPTWAKGCLKRYVEAQARACLNCGHLDLMVDPDELREKLEDRPAGLE